MGLDGVGIGADVVNRRQVERQARTTAAKIRCLGKNPIYLLGPASPWLRRRLGGLLRRRGGPLRSPAAFLEGPPLLPSPLGASPTFSSPFLPVYVFHCGLQASLPGSPGRVLS